jgi:acetyl-CoA carboxylase biotin carboxyl carrier protein
MDLRQIKNLMKEFELSTIHKLDISDSEFSIKLEKADNKSFSPLPTFPMNGTPQEVVSLEENIEKCDEVNDYIKVKSPLVGTYYQSSSPDSAPFVQLNDFVKKGDTLFIIEAMKVMNEITSPVDGKIIKINKEDDELVEFGQVIIEIKP